MRSSRTSAGASTISGPTYLPLAGLPTRSLNWPRSSDTAATGPLHLALASVNATVRRGLVVDLPSDRRGRVPDWFLAPPSSRRLRGYRIDPDSSVPWSVVGTLVRDLGDSGRRGYDVASCADPLGCFRGRPRPMLRPDGVRIALHELHA